MKTKLTKAQKAALLKLTLEGQSAYELRTSLKVLQALADKGLAKIHHEVGSIAMPRTCIKFWLSPAGMAAASELVED